METVYEIPLVAQPQTLTVTLLGVQYQLVVQWCVPQGVWLLSISDSSGNLIIGSLPMICGANLLEQYAYLGIGGQLVVVTDGDVMAPPTFDNLGAKANLYFIPNGE